MVVLDLKFILLLFLGLLAGVGWGAVLLSHHSVRRREKPSEATVLAAVNVAPFGVVLLEKDQIAYANEFASTFLRIPPEYQVLPDADWLPLLREDRDKAHQDGVTKGLYRIVTFASGTTARWWVFPLAQRDIVFIFDMTSQIRAEHTGRALINDLGHELRTPVGTLLTHLEILGLDNVGAEAQQQSLFLARQEAQRMGRLINDMLELGRLEVSDTLTLRPVNIVSLIQDVILQSTPFAQGKDMAITLDVPPKVPLIHGHADRLRQVFLNLIDNAVKYASSGDRVNILIQTTEQGIQCSVCDNGPGIASESIPHITRRFFRAAPKDIEGSGLGLALVSEILRRHNSQLQIESLVTKDGGTCMHFLLPLDKSTPVP